MSEALTFDAFAQRLLQLIDQGRVTATYKYAVLLGLLEVLLENSVEDGSAPSTVRTRDLAAAVLEIYWSHTLPFDEQHSQLRQNQTGQAEILTLISCFRAASVGDATSPLGQARRQQPAAFEKLVRAIEWKLIEMPLGKLQLVGDQYDPFIYELNWDPMPKAARVKADDFEGRLLLAAGAGDHLLRAAPLLRPLVQNAWVIAVSKFNKLVKPDLSAFLFDSDRVSLAAITPGLRDAAGGRCFYCEGAVRTGHVDHFVPWARHIDNGIHNLVYAHDTCNAAKSANLAAQEHLERWLTRVADPDGQLLQLAEDRHWDCAPAKSLGAARSIYLGLPSSYKLWVRSRHFEPIRAERLAEVFAVSGGPVAAFRHPAIEAIRPSVPRHG